MQSRLHMELWMIDSQLLAFAGLAFVIAITPGADTMLVA